MKPSPADPIRIAIVNDFEIVVQGLARMCDPYQDRIEVVELDANVPPKERVDIALYDTFGQPQGDSADFRRVMNDSNAERVVVYSWNLDPRLVDGALKRGAAGYLSKGVPAAELVADLEKIVGGECVITQEPDLGTNVGDWPGRNEGLTNREAEIISMITEGLSNQEIATRAYLSINSVKSYIRSSYRKMNVGSRSQAVLWGIEHGFRPDVTRLGGPPPR